MSVEGESALDDQIGNDLRVAGEQLFEPRVLARPLSLEKSWCSSKLMGMQICRFP